MTRPRFCTGRDWTQMHHQTDSTSNTSRLHSARVAGHADQRTAVDLTCCGRASAPKEQRVRALWPSTQTIKARHWCCNPIAADCQGQNPQRLAPLRAGSLHLGLGTRGSTKGQGVRTSSQPQLPGAATARKPLLGGSPVRNLHHSHPARRPQQAPHPRWHAFLR